MDNIILRGATQQTDLQQLKDLYYTAFYPERVDEFVEILYKHMPNLPKSNWLVAEDVTEKKIVSAIALIPWKWKLESVELNVAEMGIVATLPEYRGKGLMHKLNKEFESLMHAGNYWVSMIQGIPGFYYKLGYEYAVELENHINVPLHALEQESQNFGFNIRKADINDISYLIEEDKVFNKKFEVSNIRSKEHWHYLLTHGQKTETIADFYIVENANQKCFFKILKYGFGMGLHVAEASENMTVLQVKACLHYLHKIAKETEKPFLRLNMHRKSSLSQYAIAMGADTGTSYALQMKLTNILSVLNAMKALFEQRVSSSAFRDFSGVYRLDLYQWAIDLRWESGKLESIDKACDTNAEFVFAVNSRWLPRLIFGHNTWREIQNLHPDVSPAIKATDPVSRGNATFVGEFMNVLFPKLKGWINLQY